MNFGEKMNCPKCGKDDIMTVGYFSQEGTTFYCRKCGTLFKKGKRPKTLE